MRALPSLLLGLLLAPACAPDADSADPCADAPVVTGENFGDALLTGHCQSCHASTSPDRAGAPLEVSFDTHADAIAQKDAILRVATGDATTMPPALTIGEVDRERLRIWLTCWE